MWLPKNLSGDIRGSVSQNLISDLVRTSFASRSDLVKVAASQNPARRGFGKALQWSAAAVVVACGAASGQGAVFGQRAKRFVKGLEDDLKKESRSDPAVCHGEVDERVEWHEVESTIEIIGI